MSYLELTDLKAQVKTALSDTELQAVLDRVEGELTYYLGAPDAASLVEDFVFEHPSKYLYLKRPISSVTSIIPDYENAPTDTLDSDYYRVIGKEGTIERIDGANWTQDLLVRVTYVPLEQEYLWKRAIIDLVRLDLERPAVDAESIAGEYSMTAGNFDAKRRAIVRRLSFVTL